MAVPELKKVHIDLIPEFSGEPEIFNRFIEISEKLVNKFANLEDPLDFQNEMLLSSILSKIKGKAAQVVHSNSFGNWTELKECLVNAYCDKRDACTLGIEIANCRQTGNENSFQFYERLQKLLNLQIAHFKTTETPVKATILSDYAREFTLRVLLRGLRDPIGSLMRAKDPQDLPSALNMLTNDFQYTNETSFFAKNVVKPPGKPPNLTPQNRNYRSYTPQTGYNPPNHGNNSQNPTAKGSSYRPYGQQNTPNQGSQDRRGWTSPGNSQYRPTPMSISTNNSRQQFTPRRLFNNNINMGQLEYDPDDFPQEVLDQRSKDQAPVEPHFLGNTTGKEQSP